MSQLLLMVSGSKAGGSTGGPPDGGDVGGVPVDPALPAGFVATSDPVLASLRPSGMVAVSQVTAVPGDDVGTRLDQIKAAKDAVVPTPYGREGPDHSGILFLPPGEYVGGFGTGMWLSIVGTTGNPEDVVIYSDTTRADGVMHPYSPVYIEGVTLKGAWNADLDQSPKYAAHIAGSNRTTFANVIFDVTEAHISSAADSTYGNAGTVGMDGSPGTVLTFYRCDFRDVTGEGRLGMNLHGGPAGDFKSTISFIDCTIPKGVGYNYGGDDTPADEVYVIGGTVGGSFEMGGSVRVYTDHDNPVNGALSVTRNHTDWPQPVGHGLVQFWLDYLYPSGLSKIGTTEARAAVTDTAPMGLTSGRTYYCPIPVTEALHFNRFGIYVRSGAGAAWGWVPNPDVGVYYGSPVPAHLPGRAAGEDLRQPIGTNGVLPDGKMLSAYYYSWMVYPATSMGGNYMWFGFKVADASGVTVDGSAQLPGMLDCYYSDDDGTTLVKVAEGTPFPVAHAAQVK